MGARIDMIGLRFGSLVVSGLGPLARTPSGRVRRLWGCFCECGKVTFADRQSLRSGNTTSCGCKKLTLIGRANRTHGLTKTRTYRIWAGMIQRCRSGHRRYQARGISVSERWLSFDSFFADMGECPPRYTIDREKNDRGYEPGNCRWVPHKVNCRNKGNNRRLAYHGEILTIAEWAERTGLARNTISSRLRLGWTTRKVLSTPVRAQFGQRAA